MVMFGMAEMIFCGTRFREPVCPQIAMGGCPVANVPSGLLLHSPKRSASFLGIALQFNRHAGSEWLQQTYPQIRAQFLGMDFHW
jgi:hypothetical protein